MEIRVPNVMVSLDRLEGLVFRVLGFRVLGF